ncbi:hypothetical protein M3P36_09160 [Altererythrobacter sp. KTW20L]|uniref:hypothetical protein n=1 Tax=Altererythrobacter sp. KTW20L TaxID=2942210 RepID=UPI0020BE4A11|nr:hypothetical protein [Altererythrobacter sp. KTW20L]MCL6251208.1 hypothetical protein [Altererythrobacter sp. KTW20L]
MEQERIARVMARIEAAARRIEAAARQVPATRPPAAPTPSPAPIASDLAQKHERLRQEAWAALAEIDSLIETLDA